MMVDGPACVVLMGLKARMSCSNIKERCDYVRGTWERDVDGVTSFRVVNNGGYCDDVKSIVVQFPGQRRGGNF